MVAVGCAGGKSGGQCGGKLVHSGNISDSMLVRGIVMSYWIPLLVVPWIGRGGGMVLQILFMQHRAINHIISYLRYIQQRVCCGERLIG